MKQGKREIVKRLRFLALQAEQLEALLKSENMIFTDFVHRLIAQEVMRKANYVPFVDQSIQPDLNIKKRMRGSSTEQSIQRPVSKLDPKFLLELGRIGNNINQIARSLNVLCLQNQQSQQQFSFLYCLDELQKIQNELHQHLDALPHFQRSEQAVKNARARAISNAEFEEDLVDDD